LNLTKFELVEERKKQVKRIKKLQELYANDQQGFFELLQEDPVYLSHLTALETVLKCSLEHLIIPKK
jgi:hypothetical protein